MLEENSSITQKISRREAKLLQAIEMDADRFASKAAVLEFMRRGNKAAGVSAALSSKAVYDKNLRHALRMLFLNLYNTFRMFSSHQEQISCMYFRAHPPSFIRFLWLTQITDEIINKFDMLKGKIDHPAKDIIFFEIAYCDITGLPYDKSIGEYYSSRESLGYALGVLKDLRKIMRYFSDPLRPLN